MAKDEKKIQLQYVRKGDYFYPNLTISDEEVILREYREAKKKWLKQYHKGVYDGKLLSGKLDNYLREVDEEAQEMEDNLVNQMAEREGLTKELKEKDPAAYSRQLKNIEFRAEEIVMHDKIYSL